MKQLLCIAAGAVMLTACGGGSTKTSDDIIISEDINMEHRVLNFDNTRKEGGAHSGQYYSGVDVSNKYGAGYAMVIADSLKEKNMTVYVDGWMREKEAPLEGGIAVSLSTSQGTKFWKVLVPANKTEANQWVHVKDSVTINKDLLKDKFVEIGVFGYKDNGPDALDMDDLHIKYKFFK
ncbi:MAG: hypothetical protein JST26_08520 [Bacteroidetes bacterium]|nr:hypothetical protein [Bacteroidota bacterium]